MEQDQQERAGSLVAHRRFELGMSASALAKLAEVDAKTLRSLERGERWPQDVSRAKIEAALGWVAGALDALRDGAALPDVLRDDEFVAGGDATPGPSGRPVVDLRRIGRVLGLDVRYLDAIDDQEARPLLAKLTVAFDESGLAQEAKKKREASAVADWADSLHDADPSEDIYGLAALKRPSEGKRLKREADALGEESQDPGDDEPA